MGGVHLKISYTLQFVYVCIYRLHIDKKTIVYGSKCGFDGLQRLDHLLEYLSRLPSTPISIRINNNNLLHDNASFFFLWPFLLFFFLETCRAYDWISLRQMAPQYNGSVCPQIFSNIQPRKYLQPSVVCCVALNECRSAKAFFESKLSLLVWLKIFSSFDNWSLATVLKNAQAKYRVTLKTQKQCNSRRSHCKYTAELTTWNSQFHLDICCRRAPAVCECAARVHTFTLGSRSQCPQSYEKPSVVVFVEIPSEGFKAVHV